MSRRTPVIPSRDTRIEIENEDGQVLILTLCGITRVHASPASVLSETLELMNEGALVHTTEAGTVFGALLEHLPISPPK